MRRAISTGLPMGLVLSIYNINSRTLLATVHLLYLARISSGLEDDQDKCSRGATQGTGRPEQCILAI